MQEISIGLAFAAGLLSFASPCVLALVPVYLAFLGEAAGASGERQPVIGQALLFVAGFSIVFVLLGASLGLVGGTLFRVDEVRQLAGIVVVALGLITTGVFGPILDRLRVPVSTDLLPAGRSTRSLALGALVGVGWTPCIGAVLGGIFMMGASSQQALVATVLLIAYSAGLAIPFLAAAVALPRLRPLMNALRRGYRYVAIVSGLFIVAIGVLILTNAFARMASFFTPL
ncbi:MAG: cytochrome c biogenesis protein CcdA [Chloroflexota bacterium]|nr:cytochrome c biogenesis protein CcdA [Chloroflexota bacterium]